MTYTISVGKYGCELMVVRMPDDYTITEDIERDDVDELGDIWDCYCVVDDAYITVTDDDGNKVYEGVPTESSGNVDATKDYNGKTVIHEVGWRNQTYTSENLPQYVTVDFGGWSSLCLKTDDMEFDSSWDGRYEEIHLV